MRYNFSSMVMRDLTLRSAQTFGSFHLIRLLLDELVTHIIDQKLQKPSFQLQRIDLNIKQGIDAVFVTGSRLVQNLIPTSLVSF